MFLMSHLKSRGVSTDCVGKFRRCQLANGYMTMFYCLIDIDIMGCLRRQSQHNVKGLAIFKKICFWKR
jgi:hypothetical protein